MKDFISALIGGAILVGYALLSHNGKKQEAREKKLLEEKEEKEKLEEEEKAKQRSIDASEKARSDQKRLKELQNKFLTSSTSRIHGRHIARQVRVVSVDNCASQNQAELKFLEEIEASGSNGAINMTLRRHRGGYVSVSGDAVILK